MSDTKKLSHYLAAWELSNPNLLARTRTSHIYTVTHGAETFILKLLSPLETEGQRGTLSLRYFDGQGAVRLLRHDESAQLMEYAAGDALVTLVERDEDERATRIIAQEMPGLVHNEARLLTNAAILAEMLKLDPWRVLAFTYAYACLNASWWLQLGGSDIVRWAIKVAEIIEPHLDPRLA